MGEGEREGEGQDARKVDYSIPPIVTTFTRLKSKSASLAGMKKSAIGQNPFTKLDWPLISSTYQSFSRSR